MKKSLLISSLVFAGATSAWATASFQEWGGGNLDRLNNSSTEWTYNSLGDNHYAQRYDGLGWTGSAFRHDGTHNSSSSNVNLEHHRQNTTINLNQNARYEINFDFSLTQNGASSGDLAMAGMYLAGSGGSIFFGNAQLGRHDDRRDAVLVKYNADIAEYNDNAGEDVYFPNGEFEYKFSSPFDYHSPVSGQLYTVVDGRSDNTFDTGLYSLKIIIEAFADENEKDQLYLYANTPDGSRGFVAQQGLEGIGFAHDAYFDAYGFVLHNDGTSTATAEKMTGYEYLRTLKPTEEPDVPEVPDIPEPSAFGLLAGLGALVLTASRRRRK